MESTHFILKHSNFGMAKYRYQNITNLTLEMDYKLKVTPITFWPKYKNLPKCTKSCSTGNLEVAAKNFDVLTKNRFIHLEIRGLKGSISGNFCVVCLNL